MEDQQAEQRKVHQDNSNGGHGPEDSNKLNKDSQDDGGKKQQNN